MKSFIFLLTLSLSTQLLAECRYTIIKQDKEFLLVQKILGELPNKNANIEMSKKLKRGINDIKYREHSAPDGDLVDESEKSSRLKVRFVTEDEALAKQFLKRYCP
tara:strand:- start:303 stop:617 length:315 start_codon:yes stop_codon:yes gene_type:complete